MGENEEKIKTQKGAGQLTIPAPFYLLAKRVSIIRSNTSHPWSCPVILYTLQHEPSDDFPRERYYLMFL
ncbi:hypothetical protein [Melghirimyces thermohalophilus]|uniref:hypothetical protein n=1 Tax=Melghirimyces thermohalophilus TaxID=1236220 RepID=UPI00115FFEE1|nr:hypothetical protein [Melghirimyces thermohalophilus]